MGSRWFKAGWAASTALLILVGVSASVLGACVVARSEAQTSRDAVKASSAEIAATLLLAINHGEDLIVNASAFVAGDPHASSADFARWATTARALERHPELQGLGHTVIVPASKLAAFAAAAERHPANPMTAGRRFRLIPPGPRPFYCFVVGAIARDKRVTIPPGYDFCGNAPVGPWALAARDSGVSAYLPIKVGARTMLAVHAPVYRRGRTPSTIAGRRAAFVGWVGMSVAPTVILNRALVRHRHNAVIFRYRAGRSKAVFRAGTAPRAAVSTTIDWHNGWTVQIFSPARTGGFLGSWNALVLLIGGGALSVLVGLLDRARRRRSRAQIEESVLRESGHRLDALLQNTSDMITVVAVDATVLYQTGSVYSVLGHTPSRMVGANLGDWLDPDGVPLLLRLCRTVETAGAELSLRHADGGMRACEVRATRLVDHPAGSASS